MSTRQISVTMERKCDNCGKVVVWDAARIRPEDEAKLTQFYLIGGNSSTRPERRWLAPCTPARRFARKKSSLAIR